MTGMLDNGKIDITCPQCKGKFTVTVGNLKRPGVKCPKCGGQFDTSQFKREMDKVERQLKDLGKSLGDIKIKI